MFSAAKVSSDFLATSGGLSLVNNVVFECFEGGLCGGIQAEVSLFVIKTVQALWKFYSNEGDDLPVISLRFLE